MSTGHDLLLVTAHTPTIGAVASALNQNGRFATECVCRDLDHLIAHLEIEPVAAVLVDVDDAPKRTLARLEPIIARFAETRFIVLSSDQEYGVMLEAMQIGARHFLIKQDIAADLAGVLARLVPCGPARSGISGTIITVLGASGGCGATTVSVNVANELQLLYEEPALIVDLDCCYGAAASYLGVQGEYGLADILSDHTRIDSNLVRSTAQAYAEGLHVLLGPTTTGEAPGDRLDYAHLGEVLDACRRAYRYTVIDAPRLPLDVTADLCLSSRCTLLVFQLAVKDVRFAQTLLAALMDRGIAADRLLLVANRCSRRHTMVTTKEAEAALSGFSVVAVGNDFTSAIRSLNYGQPLAQAAPRSTLRRELRSLAATLSEVPSDFTTVMAMA